MDNTELPREAETDEYLASFRTANPLEQLGEFRLMMAIYEEGVRTAMSLRGQRTKFRQLALGERREILKALVWLFSEDRSTFYAIRAIADVVELNIDDVRRRVLYWLRMSEGQLHEFLTREITVFLNTRDPRGRPRKPIPGPDDEMLATVRAVFNK